MQEHKLLQRNQNPKIYDRAEVNARLVAIK